MPRERFCDVCRNWHSLEAPWPSACVKQEAPKRADLAAPNVNFDTMEPVQSMTNGQMYDSKAALRAEYKRAGVVEVGDDSSVTAPPPRPKTRTDRAEVRKSIKKSIDRVGGL